MSVSDFRQNFDQVEVCHLPEVPSLSGTSVRPWSSIMHHGNWVQNISAGGPAHLGFFWQNPQFHLKLSQVDPSSEPRTCSFVLSLMQKHQRRTGVTLAIALQVYQAHPQNTFLSRSDLSSTRPLLYNSQYSSRREVVLRDALPPGHYIIIPSTSEVNQQGAFMLRVLTEQGNVATPAPTPATADISSVKEPSYPHQAALPSPKSTKLLFEKYSTKNGYCKPLHLYYLLKEAIQGGVLNGCEKFLALEHCKSLVVLMDTKYTAQLNWQEFQALWEKICRWTDIFLVYDKNQSKRLEYQEVAPALKAAGIMVDDMVMQLVGLRYTEPDLTISYPGFIYLLMKLDRMIHKFQAYDVVGMGAITVSYRQWLQMTLYN